MAFAQQMRFDLYKITVSHTETEQTLTDVMKNIASPMALKLQTSSPVFHSPKTYCKLILRYVSIKLIVHFREEAVIQPH